LPDDDDPSTPLTDHGYKLLFVGHDRSSWVMVAFSSQQSPFLAAKDFSGSSGSRSHRVHEPIAPEAINGAAQVACDRHETSNIE
jgi:hypothetical protein